MFSLWGPRVFTSNEGLWGCSSLGCWLSGVGAVVGAGVGSGAVVLGFPSSGAFLGVTLAIYPSTRSEVSLGLTHELQCQVAVANRGGIISTASQPSQLASGRDGLRVSMAMGVRAVPAWAAQVTTGALGAVGGGRAGPS